MKTVTTLTIAIISFNLCSADLTKNDGKVYNNIKILKVKSAGLEVLHSSGIAFVRFIDLPESVQKEYKFDKDAYLKAENEKQKLKDERRKRRSEAARKLKQAQDERLKKSQTEKQKNKSARAFSNNNNLKQKIIKNGYVACFKTRDLFKIKSSDKVVSYPQLDETCIVSGQYMVYQGRIYRVFNNTVNAEIRLKELDKEIRLLKAAIGDYNDKISQNRDKIASDMKRNSEGDIVINEAIKEKNKNNILNPDKKTEEKIEDKVFTTEEKFFRAGVKNKRKFMRKSSSDYSDKISEKRALLEAKQKIYETISKAIENFSASKNP